MWSAEDRRRRLVARHHLAASPGAEPLAAITRVVHDVVGLHATDPVSVYLQVAARVPGATTADVDRLLYEDRTLVRVLAMRRTMFVVEARDAAMLRAALTDRLADRELRRNAGWLEADGIAEDGEAWMRAVGQDTLAALARHGPMTAMELRERVPALVTQVTVNRGRPSEATIGMSTRVLFWLATTGAIVRGRPGGTIASTSWTWARTADWIETVERAREPKAADEDRLAGSGLDDATDLEPVGDTNVDPEVAEAGVVARYLATFGPATAVDVQWWTGWTKTATTRALAAARTVAVEVATGSNGDVGEAFVLPGDEEPPAASESHPSGVSLLPALDATPMGWKERGWYLGDHTGFPGPLFDRNGNIGPTVWQDGRVVGAWAQRDDGRIAWRLFDDVDPGPLASPLEAEAERLRAFLGDVVVRPRFRTPWQVELQSGG